MVLFFFFFFKAYWDILGFIFLPFILGMGFISYCSAIFLMIIQVMENGIYDGLISEDVPWDILPTRML